MGIYMPTVDMPANCTECKLRLIVGCNPYKDNGLSPSKERHKDCPLVEIKTPHGEWIYGTDEDGIEDLYPLTCSVCGEKYPWQPNFCPNCGARMKGADNERL